MKTVVFDLRSSIAHFRRPDTTATHMTYPFIPPTVVKGIVGAILGIEDFVTKDQIGIQINSKIMLVSQQLSLLSSNTSTFNRPTTIQLVVQPSYRIYYTGEEYTDQLESYLKEKRSVYTTYLGSAFSLTNPVYVGTFIGQEVKNDIETVCSKSVVPVPMVKRLLMEEDYIYQRANGFLQTYRGNRTFQGSVDFIYEQNGRSISFVPQITNGSFRMLEIEDDVICLM